MTSNQKQHRQPQKRWRSLVKTGRGCPSLVGGRPAKSVVRNGRVGSNPTPRANKLQDESKRFEEVS